jgi:hypothetical protein
VREYEAASRMTITKPRPPRAALYHPLSDSHLRDLAAEIAHSLRMAQDEGNILAKVHETTLDRVLFSRWTASGVTSQGVVSFNALKHNCFALRHSANAAAVWTELGQPRSVLARRPDGRPYLIHDHAVPKPELRRRLAPLAGDDDAVFAALKRLCVAAVITPEEQDALRLAGLESAMPLGWKGEDPWQKYAGVVALRAPLGLIAPS